MEILSSDAVTAFLKTTKILIYSYNNTNLSRCYLKFNRFLMCSLTRQNDFHALLSSHFCWQYFLGFAFTSVSEFYSGNSKSS